MIRHAISREHASDNTKYHCLYGYYLLGLPKCKLSQLYAKSPSTIASGISSYEKNGTISRSSQDARSNRKFTPFIKSWLVFLYEKEPLLYLDEAKTRYLKQFFITIHASTIWNVLREAGLTWKVLEQRAVKISSRDIIRFANELQSMPWILHNLVFLDEVSFDERDMIRSHGYCKKGTKLIYRGEFTRKPRVSLLCFVGIGGLLNAFMTEGTFTRLKFVECIRQFGCSHDVKQYPSENSIWILDGAKIHCHSNIVYYLRSIGVVPIFLPAYCPFFNPIEFLFGLVKRKFRSLSNEKPNGNTATLVSTAVLSFTTYNFKHIFKKCGYLADGEFNPGIGLGQDVDDIGYYEHKNDFNSRDASFI